MKITNKMTWIGVPIIIAALIGWGICLAILWTKGTNQWQPIVAETLKYPSALGGMIRWAIIGGIVGYVIALGFEISKWHKSLDNGKVIDFTLKQWFKGKSSLWVVGCFIIASWIIFFVWRGDL